MGKNKMATVDVQQDVLPDAPNIFLFPSDEWYEGDGYERLRCELGHQMVQDGATI